MLYMIASMSMYEQTRFMWHFNGNYRLSLWPDSINESVWDVPWIHGCSWIYFAVILLVPEGVFWRCFICRVQWWCWSHRLMVCICFHCRFVRPSADAACSHLCIGWQVTLTKQGWKIPESEKYHEHVPLAKQNIFVIKVENSRKDRNENQKVRKVTLRLLMMKARSIFAIALISSIGNSHFLKQLRVARCALHFIHHSLE